MKTEKELQILAVNQMKESNFIPVNYTEEAKEVQPHWIKLLGYHVNKKESSQLIDGHRATTITNYYAHGHIREVTGDHYIHTYVELHINKVPKDFGKLEEYIS